MIRKISPQAYLQLLNARVTQFKAVEKDDLRIPHVRVQGSDSLIAGRGNEVAKELLKAQANSSQPLLLRHGDRIEVFLRIDLYQKYYLQVASYRVALMELPDNKYGLKSIRYDWNLHARQGGEWDHVLGDNPAHAQAHMHINFLPPGDKDCRMPTTAVCPILLLCAFDHWYGTTFGL